MADLSVVLGKSVDSVKPQDAKITHGCMHRAWCRGF